MPKNKHQPVLLKEVLSCLKPKRGESYLDLTAGYGGHAEAVLEKTRNPAAAVLVDRDAFAIAHLKKFFGASQVVKSDFLTALDKFSKSGRQFDMILADLGVSSPHLENAERGFSFRHPGPLDMRMDQSQKLDAEYILNSYSQSRLEKILREFGEEPKARQIAARIIRSRPLHSTDQLADIARSAWPGHSKVHPATRTFQAVRIAVNDELGQLSGALVQIPKVLKPGGRVVIISFHSLEDRLVKEFFKDNSGGYDAQLELITKKPLLAAKTEIVFHPRARSAKLRAAAKIKKQIER